VPCHTTSPRGLIPPPIKRAKTLVSCVAVTVIRVKCTVLWLPICVAATVGGLCRKVPLPDILRPDKIGGVAPGFRGGSSAKFEDSLINDTVRVERAAQMVTDLRLRAT
jgi:hypothetical protein